MKRCPECRRDYFDDSLLYCLDDGSALLEGPGGGEPETARFEGVNGPSTGGTATEATRLFEGEQSLPGSMSSAEYLIGGLKKYRWGVIAGALILTAAVAVGFVSYRYSGLFGPDGHRFEKFSITRVSTTGRDQEAAISPDGKYIVYLRLEDDGNRGLYVKQTATGNAITIVPPTKGNILKGTTFSPDGNFVYYLFSDRTRNPSLYQVSSLGGTAKKVLDVCESAVAFSPDGRKMAFIRYSDPSVSTVVTANIDGTAERSLAELQSNEYFTYKGPSWSPDGKTIAATSGELVNGVESMKLLGVDAESGAIRDLSPKRWSEAGRVVWMPDSTALVLIATENVNDPAGQIWRVAYPSGEAGRITNDVNGYDDTSLGVTSDGRTILGVTQQRFSRIETVLASGGSDRPLRISTSDSNQDGFRGLTFVPDGRIVFASFEGGQEDLWIINADGSGRQRLTSDTHLDSDPAVSPDGQTIVFRSNRPDGQAVLRLWKMNLDGTNAVQLAPRADSAPDISPDGRSVIFSYWGDNMNALAKVPVKGGDAVRLTAFSAWAPTVSPDGQWIGVNTNGSYGIIPAAGGDPVRSFNFPGFQYAWVRWTRDGRNISHIGAPPDPSNVWLQPAEGDAAKKLTDFKTDYIFRHAWSPNGKTLAVARGRPAFDVVLLKAGN